MAEGGFLKFLFGNPVGSDYADSIHPLWFAWHLRRSRRLGHLAQIRRQGAELESARTIVPLEFPALRPDRPAVRTAARYDPGLALPASRSDLCLLLLGCRVRRGTGAAASARRMPVELRALPIQSARADPL